MLLLLPAAMVALTSKMTSFCVSASVLYISARRDSDVVVVVSDVSFFCSCTLAYSLFSTAVVARNEDEVARGAATCV